MQNKLVDLNNHLFAQMERLSDESLTADELEKEVIRSKSIVSVSDQIVSNAKVVLAAEQFKSGGDSLPRDGHMPPMLSSEAPL